MERWVAFVVTSANTAPLNETLAYPWQPSAVQYSASHKSPVIAIFTGISRKCGRWEGCMRIIVCVIGVVGLSDTAGRLRTSALKTPMRIYPPLDSHWCLYLAVVAHAGWGSLKPSGC